MTESGDLSINGARRDEWQSAAGPDATRVAAVHFLASRAALLGRPVRFNASESSAGLHQHLAAYPDGAVARLDPPDEAGPYTPDLPAGDPPPPPPRYADQLRAIAQTGQLGRIEAAAAMCASLQTQVSQEHGEDSAVSWRMLTIRAHITALAGDHQQAARFYTDATQDLTRHRAPRIEVKQAAVNALLCWQRMRDRVAALPVGDRIVAVLQHSLGQGDPVTKDAEAQLLRELTEAP